MLVTMNLVVIFVSSSLGLPLSEDKPLSTGSQKMDATSQKLHITTLLELPTSSPLLTVANKMKQNMLGIKQSMLGKLNKEIKVKQSILEKLNTGEKELVEIKSLEKTRNNEEEEKSLRKMPRTRTSKRRRRMSRRRRIPLCMSRCLILGLIHPAQCHSLCS